MKRILTSKQAGASVRRGMTKIEFLVVMLFLVFIVSMFSPPSLNPRETARRMACSNNMKHMGIAFHNYHDDHGVLPPPSGPIVPAAPDNGDEEELEVTDETAIPSVSEDWTWRIRILPLIECQPQFDRFRFDEPWDSEHNLTVAEKMPDEYSCPSDMQGFKEINGHEIPLTNYVMITGPNTVGPTDGSTRTLSDVTDPQGQTLMIVEVWGENRPAWIEPIDVTLEDLERGVNAESGMSISGHHLSDSHLFSEDKFNGMHFCFIDGSIHSFTSGQSPTEPEQLLRMAIINDGEPIVEWD